MSRCTRKSDWYHDVPGNTCPTCKGTGHGTSMDPVTGELTDYDACPECGGFGKVNDSGDGGAR